MQARLLLLILLLAAPLTARADDLIVLLEQGNCPDCQLADVDLVHADLQDADLRRAQLQRANLCLLYTSPSPRDGLLSRMPSSA